MSHAVKIKTIYKEWDRLKEAFQSLGWKIDTNTKINTYPYDPARDRIFQYVARNPVQNGYDVGIDVKNGELEVVCDFFGGTVASQLGANLNKLTQEYTYKLTEYVYLYNGAKAVNRLQNNDGTYDIEILA